MYKQAWEEEWERVLWKKKPYPDNYVPRSFLASLSRNREFDALCIREGASYTYECAANFQPYTYRHLVVLSCPISQHLASIFVFLAIFMRLRQRLLDPRALVWVSGGAFLAGYTIWELLERHRGDKTVRATNRMSWCCFLVCMFPDPKAFPRCQSAEDVHSCLSGAHVTFASPEDSDRGDVFGLDLGVVCVSLHIERVARRLHSHEATKPAA